MRGVPPGGVAEGRVPADAGCCANAGDAADNNSARPAMAVSDLAVMLVPFRSVPSPRPP